MSIAAIPTEVASRPRRSLRRLVLPSVLALIAVGAVVAWRVYGSAGAPPAVTGTFYSIHPMDLEIKFTKDGELQAINSIEVICQVEGVSTIQTLVKEGTFVKKGDVLVTLDSSAIKQRIEDTTLSLQQAEADLITAKEMKAIQESQNATNFEAAQIAVTLAKLDLQQYTEGSYPQQLKDAQVNVEMAKISVDNADADLKQTKELFAKGFVTEADMKKSELALVTANNAWEKAKTSLEVLTKYQHEMDEAAKKNAMVVAEQRLIRTQRENAAILAQKSADVQAKQEALALLKRRQEHLQEQFDACTIKAPSDGMVVYASTSERYSQTQIQEGAQIRERQLILRLPETASMKAVLRVPESMVPKLQEGQRAMVRIVGVPNRLGATLTKISILADNQSRYFNPDLKEYPIDLTLDDTPANMKPGIGCQAELFISRYEHVLAVPLASIYVAGGDSYVFIKDADNVKPTKVTIGATNETDAEVKQGVAAGQEVIILQSGQGRELLERAGIKVAPATRPSEGWGKKRRNTSQQQTPAVPAAQKTAGAGGADKVPAKAGRS